MLALEYGGEAEKRDSNCPPSHPILPHSTFLSSKRQPNHREGEGWRRKAVDKNSSLARGNEFSEVPFVITCAGAFLRCAAFVAAGQFRRNPSQVGGMVPVLQPVLCCLLCQLRRPAARPTASRLLKMSIETCRRAKHWWSFVHECVSYRHFNDTKVFSSVVGHWIPGPPWFNRARQ